MYHCSGCIKSAAGFSHHTTVSIVGNWQLSRETRKTHRTDNMRECYCCLLNVCCLQVPVAPGSAILERPAGLADAKDAKDVKDTSLTT